MSGSDVIGMAFAAACLFFVACFYVLTFFTSLGRAAAWAAGVTAALTLAGCYAAIELAKTL